MDSLKPPTGLEDDGWFEVKRSGRGHRNRGAASEATCTMYTQNAEDNDATVASITKQFESNLATWKQSSCRKKYHRMLKEYQPDGHAWLITKAICFATGSFSRINLTNRKRSLLQFAVFVDTSRHVAQLRDGGPLALFAQDPLYTDVDKAFLRSLDIHVLEAEIEIGNGLEPAINHFDPETMIFEFCMDTSRKAVRQFITSRAALFACTSFQGFLDPSRQLTVPSLDRSQSAVVGEETAQTMAAKHFCDEKEDAQRASKFKREYSMKWFPEFEEDNTVFHRMAIHFKNPVDDDEEGE